MKEKEIKYNKNKEEINKKRRQEYKENQEQERKKQRDRYYKNKEEILVKQKLYRKINNKKISELRKLKYINRKANDTMYVMTLRLRNRLNKFLKIKHWTKEHPTTKIIGCSPDELKKYIENKFLDGMTWKNKHLWHLDHIIPLASANDEQQLLELNHYTNIQPLWAKDNMSKGAKLDFKIEK